MCKILTFKVNFLCQKWSEFFFHWTISWVLPRKVAKMVWIFVQFSFVEYDGCFLGASYYVLAAAEGRTQEAPILSTGNFHQIGYFSKKHPWVLPECFLLWHHGVWNTWYIQLWPRQPFSIFCYQQGFLAQTCSDRNFLPKWQNFCSPTFNTKVWFIGNDFR